MHNTNHLKLKGSRYPQKAKQLSTNICTVDFIGMNKKVGVFEKTNTLNTNTSKNSKYVFEAKNTT